MIFTARILLSKPIDAGALAALPGVRMAAVGSRIAEDVAARAIAGAWYWPEAKAAIDAHEAHLEVGLAAEVGSPIDRALSLTRALASLARGDGTLAVIWDAAELAHEPAQWIAQAEDATAEDLPLLLWIAFDGREGDDGTRSLRTRGARAFGAMEVEVASSQRDGEELLETVCDVALFVITSPMPLEDGDQVEVTQGKVRVRVEPSLTNDGSKAYRLRLP